MSRKNIIDSLPEVNEPHRFLLMTPEMMSKIDPRIANSMKRARCENVAQFVRLGPRKRRHVNGYGTTSEITLKSIGQKFRFDIDNDPIPNTLACSDTVKVEVSYVIYMLKQQIGFKKRHMVFANLDQMLTFLVIFQALQSRVVDVESVQAIIRQKSTSVTLPTWLTKIKKGTSLIITKIKIL